MRIGRRLVLSVILAGLSVSAFAVVPSSITVQGRLTDSSGSPLPAGAKTLTFKIYSDSAGGTEIWPAGTGETQSVVSDAAGLWTTRIGALIPLHDSVFADTVRWLEVTVDDGVNPVTTLPRVRLTSGPYAHRVSTVDGASGGSIGGPLSIGDENEVTFGVFAAGFQHTASGPSSVAIGGSQNNVSGNSAISLGGSFNLVSGENSNVSGETNLATGDWTHLGGGYGNVAQGYYSVVGGGRDNRARGNFSVVSGGGGVGIADSNSALGEASVISGGRANTATGLTATVGGGFENHATANYATIAGGDEGEAKGLWSTVSGGGGNVARSDYATIGGGQANVADSLHSTIAGGRFNKTLGDGATVSGGSNNTARGTYAVVAGGGGADPADSNTATGHHAVIGGGLRNNVTGVASTVGGGYGNTASNSISTVGGGRSNQASGAYSTVGGGNNNRASGSHSTVAGGGGTTDANWAVGDYSAVGGGQDNDVQGNFATIAGGQTNEASELYATVGGGYNNDAYGQSATISGGSSCRTGEFAAVGGGWNNWATGNGACIPGGLGNAAEGDYSFVAGRNGRSNFAGSFVWSDSSATEFAATDANQFVIRAGNGVGINTNAPLANLGIHSDAGESSIHFDGGAQDITWLPTQRLQFGQWDGATFTERMQINAAGNVGIGTSDPSHRLDLFSSGAATTIRFRAGGSWGALLQQSDASLFTISNGGAEAIAIDASQKVGIGETSPSNILTVQQGSATNPIADAWTTYSSRRWKTNISPLTDPLDKVKQLQGVEYDWKETGEHDIGLIAEDVGAVIPEIVEYEENGVDAKSVDYARLVAVLIEAVKEQQQEIKELRNMVEQMQQ